MVGHHPAVLQNSTHCSVESFTWVESGTRLYSLLRLGFVNVVMRGLLLSITILAVAAGSANGAAARIKRQDEGQPLDDQAQVNLLQKEERAVDNIEAKINQRYDAQRSNLAQQDQETDQLGDQINQNAAAARGSGKAAEYQQKFNNEKSEIHRAENLYKAEQSNVQAKIDALQAELKDLEGKRNSGAIDFPTFKARQEQINGELNAALGRGKKDEEALSFVNQHQDQWQNGWAANPVVGNPAVAGGPSNGQAAPGGKGDKFGQSGGINLLDPKDWEQHHDEAWGNFEDFMGKWQNWTNDPNAGNYRLANERFGAFDNGEFNVEKQSEEFFGPDHVRNDWKLGNYTTNAGFGVIGPYGKGGDGTGGKGGAGGGGGGGDGGAGGAGGGGGPLSYKKGDAFWDGLAEQWKREVGEFFNKMLGKFRAANKKIIAGGVKYAQGLDMNASD